MLESGPLGRIISRLSRSKEEVEGSGSYELMPSVLKLGSQGLGLVVQHYCPIAVESQVMYTNFSKLRYPFLQNENNNTRILHNVQIHKQISRQRITL